MSKIILQLEKVTQCPICKSTDRETLYDNLVDTYLGVAPDKWHLYRCTHCETVYLDPRPTRESIGAIYAHNYYTHSVAKLPPKGIKKALFALRNGWLNRRVGYRFFPAWSIGYYLFNLFPNAFLTHWIYHARGLIPQVSISNPLIWLDVGCGNGEFLARIQTAGWLVEGIEPDQKAAHLAKQQGFKIYNETLENAQLQPNYYDVISLSHVIEHLHDPIAALQICYAALKPNGRLWLSTPNLNSFGHQLYKHHWLSLETPRHLVLFNQKSLEISLKDAGFRNIEYLPRGFHIALVYAQSEATQKGNIPTVNVSPTFFQRLKWLPQEMRHAIVQSDAEELIINAYKPLN
ncbi:MAG: hypothetical protein RIT27_2384 [Pseudomonadota bacterium]|jgi:SAM-dependent methyltransferase